jgi:biopolymer transport protein ExbB/TolQ
MNTTAFGLISAITIMVAHQILSSKAEKILGELEHYSVKLTDLLSTKKGMQAPAKPTSVENEAA